MAFSLRLPPALEADARARCERLGISLNALVCVALDAYLRAPSQSVGQTMVSASPAPLLAPEQGEVLVTPPKRLTNEPFSGSKPEEKPVLTAPPLAALVPPSVAVAPALSRVERRRLERASKKR